MKIINDSITFYWRLLVLLDYETGSVLIKAIAEPIRLQIIDILSNGELCACDILRNLSISQPTLSHHMKALIASGWVSASKRATWMYYSINGDAVEQMHQYMLNLTSRKADAPIRVVCDICACCEPANNQSQIQ
jgi:ArsR family transcriptional regulator, arsenate/arsenite/antimonite-responsive transcriptional repressor